MAKWHVQIDAGDYEVEADDEEEAERIAMDQHADMDAATATLVDDDVDDDEEEEEFGTR